MLFPADSFRSRHRGEVLALPGAGAASGSLIVYRCVDLTSVLHFAALSLSHPVSSSGCGSESVSAKSKRLSDASSSSSCSTSASRCGRCRLCFSPARRQSR